MSSESFEVYSSTFIALPLFILLYKFILYLLYKSCSSFLSGTNYKGELALQGLWTRSQTWLYPKTTQRDTRSYLPQHPRKQSNIPWMPLVNRWDSVFAATFYVIQQILAECPWCARPCARNGMVDEWGVALPRQVSQSHELLACFLYGVGGCLTAVGTGADRSLELGEGGNLLWQFSSLS